MKLFILFLSVAVLAAFAIGKNIRIPKSTGIIDGHLHPCPTSPNCVNSDATNPEQAIAPLPLVALPLIRDYFLAHYNSQVIKETPDYLHIVVTTPFFRFKDDVEFFISDDRQSISVRSAARLGYYDFNVNRTRIEKLRQNLLNNPS